MQKFKILRQPFLEEQWGRRKEKERKRKEKKSMIIVVPSCLKDADGARTRSDQFWVMKKTLIDCEIGKKNFLWKNLHNTTLVRLMSIKTFKGSIIRSSQQLQCWKVKLSLTTSLTLSTSKLPTWFSKTSLIAKLNKELVNIWIVFTIIFIDSINTIILYLIFLDILSILSTFR